MPHLAKLVRLEALYLAETRVTGAGLDSLCGLRRLYLWHAGVTDAGLNDIGELRHLELLCVDGTDVTDAGLDRLKGLAKLRELDIPQHPGRPPRAWRNFSGRCRSARFLIGRPTAGGRKPE